MRECCAGGAFAETIVTTLFGFRPGLGRDLELFEANTPRDFTGELRHLRYGSGLYTVRCSKAGVVLNRER
jgi:hypothetical protein